MVYTYDISIQQNSRLELFNVYVHWVTKIWRLENQNLWQTLNSRSGSVSHFRVCQNRFILKVRQNLFMSKSAPEPVHVKKCARTCSCQKMHQNLFMSKSVTEPVYLKKVRDETFFYPDLNQLKIKLIWMLFV